MKKILFGILCVLVVAAAIIAGCRVGSGSSVDGGSLDEQVSAVLVKNDCYVCHSQKPQLPFYAKWPLIGSVMKGHIEAAVRFIDLESRTKDMASVNEATVSMLDYAVMYNTMPIAEYKMIHWGSGLDAQEKDILLQWVMAKRGSADAIRPIPASMDVDDAKAALGEKLFSDTRLSLDGTISCATCHILAQGGADEDDERVSTGINGLKGGVNAPTVYNAVFSVRQFWNGRAADLAEQAAGPATNPVEMGDQTLEQVCKRLSADRALVKEFEALYPGEGLTPNTLTNAIAEFEKTLITPNSRFDAYLQGDKEALSESEIKGYEVFKKNACATCHTGVAMGGQSFERLGIYGDYYGDRDDDIEYCADDDGLKSFTGKSEDLYYFKVPTLRNVALTAPYFHDGQYESLEDAVEAMAEYELGRELSDKDEEAIVVFLGSLNGVNEHLKR